MEKFFKRKSMSSGQSSTPNPQPQTLDECESIELGPSLKKRFYTCGAPTMQNSWIRH
jgi:hypothetical protein